MAGAPTNRNDKIVGRFCETPWRLTQTPYNPVLRFVSSFDIRHPSLCKHPCHPGDPWFSPLLPQFVFIRGSDETIFMAISPACAV